MRVLEIVCMVLPGAAIFAVVSWRDVRRLLQSWRALPFCFICETPYALVRHSPCRYLSVCKGHEREIENEVREVMGLEPLRLPPMFYG